MALLVQSVPLLHMPKGILRQQPHQRGAPMPISFCDQSTKNQKIYQETNNEKALHHNKVGNDYFKNGYYMDAIDSYKQALKLFITMHGEEHSTVATTIGNIGNAYWKMGKPHEAIARLENSLRILKIVSKKNSDETLEVSNTLHSLGAVYYLIGDADKAIANFTRALNIRRVKHGENSIDVARTIDSIGSAYLQKGYSSNAIKHFQDALRIKHSLPETSPISLVISMKNLANALRMNQDYQKSLSLYQEIVTVQISDDTPYFTDRDVGKSFHTIGNIHMQLRQYNFAVKFFVKAFQQYRISGVKKDDPIMIELKKSMISTGMCR